MGAQINDFLANAARKHRLREEMIGATSRIMDLAHARELGPHAASTPTSSALPRPVVSLKTLYTDFEVRELPAFYGNGAPLRLELQSSCNGNGQKAEKPAHGVAPTHGDDASGTKRSREDDDQGDNVEHPIADAVKPPSPATSSFVAEVIGPLVSPDDLAVLLSGLAAEVKSIPLPSVTDKERRTQLHGAIKTCLGATHVSSTVNGVVCVVKANAADRREQRRRSRAQRPAAKYHHFTLYKENTDSNQALRMIASHLKLSSRQLQFCGTKDKRAVTLQRVAIRETTVERLTSINARTFGLHNVIKVCGFTQEDRGLRLGDANGNRFRIALRVFPRQDACSADSVESELSQSSSTLTADFLQEVERVVRAYGVMNYFGPQRFGTTKVLTSDVGVQFLRGDLREGLRLMLVSKASIVAEMANAVKLFEAQNYSEALKATPYYCYHERDVLKHLASNPNDFLGALQFTARTMAMMYFHAVQSLVWNRMASARLSGPQRMHVEVGDLVLESTYQLRTSGIAEEDARIATTTINDDEDAAADEKIPTVRKLTRANECIRFTLADVVLPVPGPDPELVYPDASGCSRADYGSVLQELGIDLESKVALSLIKIFHFHGTYRALVVRPKDFELRLETAASWRTPVLHSDWELFCAQEHIEMPFSTVPEEVAVSEPQEEIQVVVAAFSLPPGSYATSVLREFCVPSTEGFRNGETTEDE